MRTPFTAAMFALTLAGCAVCAEDYAEDYNGGGERAAAQPRQPRRWTEPPAPAEAARPERKSKSQSQ